MRLTRMTTPSAPSYDTAHLTAKVIYAGTRCEREYLLRDYPSGTLHFIRTGTAEVHLAGKPPVEIARPSLVFFPRSSQHAVRPATDAGVDMVCAVTTFDDGLRQSLALCFPEVVVVPLNDLAAIRHVVEAFFAEATAGSAGSSDMADRLCALIMAYLVRYLGEQQRQEQQHPSLLAATSDSRIATAIEAIHTLFQSGLDLDTLARTSGMSRSRFVERFKLLVGTSPHNYLVNYRIGVAQQLLARHMPVKTVAERVGYGTTASFVRKFKEVVGVPPGAWSR